MKSLLLTLLTFLITFTYVFADTSIRVSAVGDLMLTQSKVVKGIKEHGYKYPFDNVKIYFSSSDISIANLEFPISKRGIPVNKKWTFRANPSILKSLAYSGINVFGIANNHACDYGTNAFLDTIDYLKKSSFSVVGGGTDIKDARKGIVTENKEIKNSYHAMGECDEVGLINRRKEYV